jgi:hypothetical protein
VIVTVLCIHILEETNNCAINHSERGEENSENLACYMLQFFIEIEELLFWGLYGGSVNSCGKLSKSRAE